MNVHVRQLARALGSLDVPVDIFTRQLPSPEGGPAPPDAIVELAPNVRVVYLPGGAADTPMEDLYSCLPEFLEALQEFQRRHSLDYQVVHSHYWLSGWVGQRLAQSLGVPHVITFHTLARIKMQSRAGETEPLRRQQTEEELMASAHRVVAFSPHERDAMARLYGADPGRIELVPGGVDLSLFRPVDQGEARQRLGLNGDRVLLYVGRIESLKGVELLLRTAAQVDRCHHLKVLVVGADNSQGQEEMGRLRRVVQELNLETTVDFVGRVDHEELPYYYSAADVCVVPSFYESFGLAALESMACGTPVVASRVGGLSSIVQHGRTGFLKSWRCPETYAHSLEMLMSSPRLRHSMGQAARRRAEGMGWEQVAANLALLYGYLAGETAYGRSRTERWGSTPSAKGVDPGLGTGEGSTGAIGHCIGD